MNGTLFKCSIYYTEWQEQIYPVRFKALADSPVYKRSLNVHCWDAFIMYSLEAKCCLAWEFSIILLGTGWERTQNSEEEWVFHLDLKK